MPLLTARNLPKLLLRDPPHEPLQPSKHLLRILLIHRIHIRPPNQRLDPRQTIPDQMLPQPLVNLSQDQLPELGILPLPRLKHLVHEPGMQQLLRRDPLAHNQRLVRLGDAQPLHQRAGGAALGHEAERREGGEEEGGGGGVDEVGEGDEGGGEAYDGPVEADDEDLGVGVEGLGDVEVEGDEGLEPVFVGFWARGGGAGDAHVGAAVVDSSQYSFGLFPCLTGFVISSSHPVDALGLEAGLAV
ncbi:hypothetical protein CCUS01_14983 [Colletotrichum cuscutae]|uniref:Uncharacterized protein n=1 Tax=Colletotrichum cuscutae TaxID=1209917 RepID=A0AAI9VHB9_9PEZI|nr:hypothetical protein CCUS01_14983 [Colletotrichum cuscutae]